MSINMWLDETNTRVIYRTIKKRINYYENIDLWCRRDWRKKHEKRRIQKVVDC